MGTRQTTCDNQHLFAHNQFRFHKKYSTISQLAFTSDYISNCYDFREHTCIVSLGLEKVYDTVWINQILYKLINLNLPTYVIFILRTFLQSFSEWCVIHTQKYPMRSAGRCFPIITLFSICIKYRRKNLKHNWYYMLTKQPFLSNSG
jgi:hypothetical protein